MIPEISPSTVKLNHGNPYDACWYYKDSAILIKIGDRIRYRDQYNVENLDFVADLRLGYTGRPAIIAANGTALYIEEVEPVGVSAQITDAAATEIKQRAEEIYEKLLSSDLLKIQGSEVLLDMLELVKSAALLNTAKR